jgi:predicted MPP superfamily phosphohydrolase
MSSVGFILLVAACVGHTALLVFSLNWFYGHAIPHQHLSKIRFIHGLAVLAVPLLWWWSWGWDLTGILDLEPALPWQRVLAGYLLLCALVSVGLLPLITLNRLRHRPPVLLHNHTYTLDVAAQLGYKPAGQGRHRYLARLPGNKVFQVDFAERALCLPGLPAAWEGLSILHVSDLHMSGTPDREFYRAVMDACRDWEPDLVAVTGDVVDSDQHHRWILPILGRLRWRIAGLAILGNHDTWYDPLLVRRRLRRLGMDVLSNCWKQIEVRGVPMVVIGNETPWVRPTPDLTDCPAGVFRLCLSHTPDNIRWAQRNDVNLMLAGHVHGGQIRFPLIGSVLVPSRYGRRYDCGTFHEGATVLHVSRGLAGQHPLRYNCRPEVTKIVLQAGQQSLAGTAPAPLTYPA